MTHIPGHPAEVKPLVEQRLLNISGVVGVGTGRGSGPVLKVFVESTEIAKKIPSTLGGVQTKPIISGNPSFLNRFFSQKPLALQNIRTQEFRPAIGGISVGHKNITAGTLGSIVFDNKTGKKLILSNNHIFANTNKASIGDEILQQSVFDGGIIEKNTIARLSKYIIIQREGNIVDCAIAEPINPDIILDEIFEVGKVSGVTVAKEDMIVKKSGRTTGVTFGTVISTDATIRVISDAGDVVFRDCIVTTPMAEGGDSGSLLLTEDNKVTGLLFAGSNEISIHNKIQNVESALQINFGEGPPATAKSLTIPLLAGGIVGAALFMGKK